MARGKAKTTHLGIQGITGHANVPDWSFIYTASLEKDPMWNIGDHVVLPDGREFVYGKASAACASGQACEFVNTGFQAYTTPVSTTAVGDREITITGTTHDAITKDELRGGFFVSWPAALKDSIRGIIGNDAADADGNFTIYLDGPLTEIHTAASTGCEVWANPYAELRTGTSASLAKAGVPATYVSTALMYFWVQVKGISWVAPQSDVLTNHVGCYYRHDGSIESYIDFEDMAAGTNSSQYAGNRVAGNYAGNGPLFMLK